MPQTATLEQQKTLNESEKDGNETVSKKQAFKIKLKKGVQLTDSIKTKLRDNNGCRLDSQIHNAYICPIESKKDIENLFVENSIKADLIDVLDFFSNKNKKITSLENQITFFERKIKKNEDCLLIDVTRYDKTRNVSDFEDPPILKSLTEEEPEERKNNRFSLEMDFHKRLLEIKEDKKKLENLRNSFNLHEKEVSENTLRQGDYVVDKTGLYHFPVPVEGEKEPPKELISSPIWPIAHLRTKENTSHTLLIKVNDGEKDHLIPIPRRLIAKWTDLNEILLDLNQKTPIYPNSQKHLQTYLQRLNPEKKMRCIEKAGWHEEQYVFPNGEIVGGGKEGSESVYPINEVYAKGVGSQGTLEDWQENIVSLCAGNSRLIFSLGCGFASVCLNLVGGESGGFNLRGPSSKGKSKCLRVAISIIGSPEYERTWKATANGLESMCVLHNDSLLALDEMGASESKEIGQIAYSICGGIEKGRMNRSIAMRETRSWNVLLLSTAEIGLEEHMKEGNKEAKAGQLVRIVDVPAICHSQYGCFENIHGFKDSKVFADTIGDRCKKFYGTAIRDFIQKMINQGFDTAKKEILFAKDDFIADYAIGCDGQVLRVADRFGIIYGTLLLASKYGILGESITNDMIKDSIFSCFKDWLSGRGTKGDIESYKLIDGVIGMLNENSESKFANYHDQTTLTIRHALWGYRQGVVFYVFPKAFRDYLCKGMKSTDAAVILKEKRLLKPDGNKNSKSVSIPAHGKKDRFYVIDTSMIQNDVDDDDITC